MRRELRWALAASAALGLGVTFAEPYARLAAPYYAAVARLVAADHPWKVTSVDVRPGKSRLSAELQLGALIRRRREDPAPSARVIGRVQVGEVVETPVVFWTLVLMWPAGARRDRALRLVAAVPVFLGLEALTTVAQLMLPMAQASAILGGDSDPVTAWDHWSRFLEAGGRFMIEVCAALLPIALLPRRRDPRHPPADADSAVTASSY
jgi:hypothetical protein